MTEQTPTPESPVVPARVRTVVYYSALGVAFAGLVVTGVADSVLEPVVTDQINGVIDGVNRAFLFLTGALGVAYRPTR